MFKMLGPNKPVIGAMASAENNIPLSQSFDLLLVILKENLECLSGDLGFLELSEKVERIEVRWMRRMRGRT